MQHFFVVMWNRQGLQYAADQTRIQGGRVWDRIRGVDSEWCPDIQHLRIVAQQRPSLHYEIWEFLADEGITEADVYNMFTVNPQESANTVRSIGHCLYSDRPTEPAKIT